jgi:hypothetical protein
MSTVRMILSELTKLIERQPVRRRQRVRCQPNGEPMEPRALLSGFNGCVATPVSPQAATGALVMHANQAPSFNVTYQSHSTHGDDVIDQGNVETEDPSGP